MTVIYNCLECGSCSLDSETNQIIEETSVLLLIAWLFFSFNKLSTIDLYPQDNQECKTLDKHSGGIQLQYKLL